MRFVFFISLVFCATLDAAVDSFSEIGSGGPHAVEIDEFPELSRFRALLSEGEKSIDDQLKSLQALLTNDRNRLVVYIASTLRLQGGYQDPSRPWAPPATMAYKSEIPGIAEAELQNLSDRNAEGYSIDFLPRCSGWAGIDHGPCLVVKQGSQERMVVCTKKVTFHGLDPSRVYGLDRLFKDIPELLAIVGFLCAEGLKPR